MSGAHGHGHIEVEGNNKRIALLISVLALFLALVETMAKGAQTDALSYNIEASESVREHHAGLQSLRSMRRIEARRRKASALQLRFSQSLASRRQRFSQAMVRSTIQRFGRTTNPFA